MQAHATQSPRRLKATAEDLLACAHKVYHYKRDLLKPEQVKRLEALATFLEKTLENKRGPADALIPAIDSLEEHLKSLKTPLFPKKFWSENVEVFLVAAILAIGVRLFFLHPFAIPTNSMYPTYSGMQHQIYTAHSPRPSLPKELLHRLLNWRSCYTLKAPSAGLLEIPVFAPDDPRGGYGLIRYEIVRRFTPLPSQQRHYRLYVGGDPVDFYLPRDSSLDEVLTKALFPESDGTFLDFYKNQLSGKNYALRSKDLRLKTSLSFEKDQKILDFDVLCGDVLFVDRFSYHFVRPKLGDPIVFRTETIPTMRERPSEYFIKRLVGLPEDVLEVRSPALYRNGAPIQGNAAFESNAQRAPEFRGYAQRGRLSKGLEEHIPKNHYYGMGDNSYESGDSRSFGPIPQKALVGRAFFIYYPFTHRWGPAR